MATRTTELAPAEFTRTTQTTLDMPVAGPSPEELYRAAFAQPRDPERYRVIAEHGRGGLGRVSRVHDRELGRDVAIKELLARDHLREVRFLREALITARLEHPGIVPVHEAGRWPDGTPFYAMKLVSGRPLRDLIHERATVGQRIGLLHHVVAVADAIAYAHDRSIIHRDLKPANVIVGDFGETVVIDWGLAKDLTAPESSSDGGGGPFRTAGSDGLTQAGSVLGTPAYMSPEQLRGEPVDQRADVFAIGAMLWELCTLERLPAIEPALYRRTLRGAGTDEDLVTILTKALDPDPARRYRDAGGLAADLKAFTSGARIAARRYSPLAVLAHWVRHHRALAAAAAAAIVLGAVGGTLYVRNIAVERDRADTARGREAAARSDLAREHAELTLKHAQLLLTSDPSAALDTLATYDGPDHDRARELRAEAIGRGVAVVRATPHTDSVLWAAGMPDRTVVSLGMDGRIVRTSPDGRSTVVARDAAEWAPHAYAPGHHLLAYRCGVADLCLLDLVRGVHVPVPPVFHGLDAAALAFSPDGDRLALLTHDGVMQVFDVAAPERPVQRLKLATDHGTYVAFVDEGRLAIETSGGVQLASLTGELRTLPLPRGYVGDAGAAGVAFFTMQGQGIVLAIDPLRIATQQALCHDAVNRLRFVPGAHVLAYACKDGTVGTWSPADGAVVPRAHLEGEASSLAVSDDGAYVLAAGGNGTLAVIDLDTELVTVDRGHAFPLSSVVPPTREYPLLISGDARGGLRVWPLPGRLGRVVAGFHIALRAALFDVNTATLVATTDQPQLATFSARGGAHTLEPHVMDAFRIVAAASGDAFAAYGFSDAVELWSPATWSRTRVLDTHHGSVSHAEFAANSEDLITAGQDGRLVRWTGPEARTIAQFDQPIETFALAPATRSAVVATADGAVWQVADEGGVLPLETAASKVSRMMALPGGSSVSVGFSDGRLLVVNTASGHRAALLHAADAIRDIAVTPDGRIIAVATKGGIVHVGTRGERGWLDAGTSWIDLPVRARRIALTADGLLVAACTDGVIRLWSYPRRSWLCLPTGATDLNMVVTTPDRAAAVSIDTQGRVIWLDLDSVRNTLERGDPTR
ncbi:MAG TPA: serine/threonine-protein kinase [Kofleriaceae bacterium]|nr:serine/threonine-protein kinase [Kofleriaceae bacterium]